MPVIVVDASAARPVRRAVSGLLGSRMTLLPNQRDPANRAQVLARQADLALSAPLIEPACSSAVDSSRKRRSAGLIPVAVSAVRLQTDHFWARLVANRWPICGLSRFLATAIGTGRSSVRRFLPPLRLCRSTESQQTRVPPGWRCGRLERGLGRPVGGW